MKVLQTLSGTAIAASGLAIHAWLWVAAETTGRGLMLGVKVLGEPIPAILPMMAGFCLMVFGVVIGYGRNKREPVVPHESGTGNTC
jgi:hypothetical protein